jgi:hypothetical protein
LLCRSRFSQLNQQVGERQRYTTLRQRITGKGLVGAGVELGARYVLEPLGRDQQIDQRLVAARQLVTPEIRGRRRAIPPGLPRLSSSMKMLDAACGSSCKAEPLPSGLNFRRRIRYSVMIAIVEYADIMSKVMA